MFHADIIHMLSDNISYLYFFCRCYCRRGSGIGLEFPVVTAAQGQNFRNEKQKMAEAGNLEKKIYILIPELAYISKWNLSDNVVAIAMATYKERMENRNVIALKKEAR